MYMPEGRLRVAGEASANVPRVEGCDDQPEDDPTLVGAVGANLGVVTGATSGFDVLDIDPRHGGEESLATLGTEHSSLPETVESQTGGWRRGPRDDRRSRR